MLKRKDNRIFSNTTRVIVLLFFLVTIIGPLIVNLAKINWIDIPSIITSNLFVDSLVNSFVVATVAAAMALLVAFILVYIIERTNIAYKNFFRVIFIIPMLIPSISHGLGLVNLFGENGFLTLLLGVNIELYGFNGVVIGSIMYTFPIAFLMIGDIFKYMDMEMYEAAQVLGIPKFKVFKDITLGHLKKPIIATYFALFTMIFTDYGVPLAVGGKFSTLAVFLYREVVGLLDFSKGGFIALVLLVPAIITFIVDVKMKGSTNLTANPKPMVVSENKLRDILCFGVCIVAMVGILLPIASYALVALVKDYPRNMEFTWEHIRLVKDMRVGKYLANSIVIALTTGIVGTVISYLVAYLITRSTNKKYAKSLYLLSLTSLVVPGMVLGLGYVQLFSGTFLYGTVVILVMVNITHFFSSPYLLAYNALGQVSTEIEQMGLTLGISRWKLVKDVIIPTTYSTIIEMFSYFFVNAMITISAVSFLYNTRNMPLSLMINELEGQLMFKGTAVVSMIILAVNIIFKVSIYAYKKYMIGEK